MEHQRIIDTLCDVTRMANGLGGAIGQTPARDLAKLAQQVELISRILIDVVYELKNQDQSK